MLGMACNGQVHCCRADSDEWLQFRATLPPSSAMAASSAAMQSATSFVPMLPGSALDAGLAVPCRPPALCIKAVLLLTDHENFLVSPFGPNSLRGSLHIHSGMLEPMLRSHAQHAWMKVAASRRFYNTMPEAASTSTF